MPRKKKEETPSSKPKSPAKPKAKAPAKPKAVKVTAKTAKPKKETTGKAGKPWAVKTPVSKDPIKAPVAKAAKTPAAKAPIVPESIPVTTFKPLTRQGETQLIAFIRDPQCVFTYWEITPQRLDDVKKELQEEFKTSHMVLRLYEISPNGERHLAQEIRIEPDQINQYIEIKPHGAVYQLEIAQKTSSGRIISYVTSKPVATELRSALDASDPPAPSAGSPGPGMDAALEAYFEELGYGNSAEHPTGVSSMDSRQRKQKAHWSSSF